PGGGTAPATEEGTATFHVDVSSGQVSVQNLTSSSRSVFGGGTIDFQTSTLIDQPDVGRRAINVSLKNLSSDDWVADPTGGSANHPLRVFFKGFKNIDSGTDLRTLTNVAAFTGSTSGFLDGVVSSALYRSPAGVVVGPDRTIYIADTANHRIRQIRNGVVSTLAGTGSAGAVDGSGTAASFNLPTGLAITSTGNLFVTESAGNKVRRVTPAGSVTTVAGNTTAGFVDGAGGAARFSVPEGIAVDSLGNLYVADSANNRIRKILAPVGDPTLAASYTVQTFAGTGAAGFADGIKTTAIFNAPRGVAVSPEGTVYIADRLNNRVRRISSAGEVVTIAGTGVAGLSNGLGNVATLNAPSAIAWAGTGLVTFDLGSHLVRQIVLTDGSAPATASSWRVNSIAGSGGVSGGANGSGPSASFATVQGLALDGDTLYLADPSNNNLRKITASAGFPVPVQGGTATT
ncbi:MAG: hypothetical protein ABUL72_05560, partial [Armatimonadota bacterium]